MSLIFFLKPTTLAGGVTYNKSGFVTTGTLTRAADVYESTETGTVAAGTLARAADVYESTETGAVIADTNLSGFTQPVQLKTGKTLAGTFLRATDVYESTETGVVVAGTVLRGVEAVPFARTGTVAAFTWGSAPDEHTAVRTGKVLATPRLSGFFRPTAGPGGKFVITNAYVTIAGVDISRFTEKVEVNTEREPIDITPFGTQSHREWMGGVQTGTFTIEMFADPTITTAAFWTLLDSPVALEVHPRGSVITDTNPAWSATAIATKRVPLTGQVGEAAKVQIELKATTDILETT